MNATSMTAESSLAGDIYDKVWELIICTRVELLLFATAIVVWFALFGNAAPRNPKIDAKKARAQQQRDDDFNDVCTEINNRSTPLTPEECINVEKECRAAADYGDHRQILRCWNIMKRFERVPDVSLAHVVEALQRAKKDTPFIVRELKAYFKKYPHERDMGAMNDLLESLGRRLDSDLIAKIVEAIPSMDLRLDQRSYEIFLTMHFTTRDFPGVKKLVAEMKEKQIPFTTRATIVVIKAAIKTNNFPEALVYFRELKMVWTCHGVTSTPSQAPRHIISQLVELACKEHQLGEFLGELRGVPISQEVVNTMLMECARQKDVALTQRVEKLAREQKIPFTDTMYSLIMRGMIKEVARVQETFDEVLKSGIEVTADFASAVLACCAQHGNITMVDKLYSHMKPQQSPILSAFVRFYADHEQFEKACDVYENDLLPQSAPDGAGTRQQRPVLLDARVERSLMNAALRCGRSHLAKNLLEASPSDVAKHITMIRNCATENNLPGAMSVFESLKKSGVDLNSVIFNTVLDACVECRDLAAAEEWMKTTKEAGMADVVSYNTLIKAHLQNDHFDAARGLMEEMKRQGIVPNRVTFNELINALVTKGGEARRSQMWDIVAEMQAADAKPNQVTCSILLKSLNASSAETDINLTMELISTMEEDMDEVLLSSVVEACVRIGKPDLLSSKLKQVQTTSSVMVSGSHTFGSLIKAYGHAKDIDGVWRCWKEMRSRHIKPTSITLGCMVEAVVSNGDTEGAYELIHQMQDDEQCRDALNSVIYCSVLKGFTREKKIERVWAVYEEMSRKNIELSIVTYNTLIDACARCGRMEHIPGIVADMKSHRIRPNVITYSTMLKGHCQNGEIEKGFAILEQMKKDAKLKPDEIMYNSLLDGCAQNNLVDEGLRLLEEMQSEGVQPSNFTLSILVKLMNRARKLDTAFALVEDITKKYRFRANVHVYTNLVQACISNQQLQRGVSVLEQMVRERVQPDSRTYAILVRASTSKNQLDQAAGLLRAALGLPGALPHLTQSVAMCPNLDQAVVNEAVCSFAERGRAVDLAEPLLVDIRQSRGRVRIDATTQRKVMAASLAETNGSITGAAPYSGGASSFSGPRGESQRGGGSMRYSKGRGKGQRYS